MSDMLGGLRAEVRRLSDVIIEQAEALKLADEALCREHADLAAQVQRLTVERDALLSTCLDALSWLNRFVEHAPIVSGGEAELAGKLSAVLQGRAVTIPAPEVQRLTAERDDAAQRNHEAVTLALMYGQTDGAHHQRWAIDQILRVLAGDDYERLIAEYQGPDANGDTFEWDEGIAP